MKKVTTTISSALYQRVQENDPTLTTLDLVEDAKSVESARKTQALNRLGHFHYYQDFLPLDSIRVASETGQNILSMGVIRDIIFDGFSDEFETALDGNFFITQVRADSETNRYKVEALCIRRNLKLAELINVIKNPDNFKLSKTKLLSELATAVNRLKAVTGGDLMQALICIKTCLQSALMNIGVGVNGLPEHHYLKEYSRYIEGYLYALAGENDKSQWKALHFLAKPFRDADLQVSADVILQGLLAIGLFEGVGNDDFTRAKDLLSIAIGVLAATPNSSKLIELNAYIRLSEKNHARLGCLDNMRADHHACMEGLMNLLEEEASKARMNVPELRAMCGNTISDIALSIMRRFYKKPQTIFQPNDLQDISMDYMLPKNHY